MASTTKPIKPIVTLVDWWLGVAIALLVSAYSLLGPFKPPYHHVFGGCHLHAKPSTHYLYEARSVGLTGLDKKDITFLEEIQKLLPPLVHRLERDKANIHHKFIAVDSAYNTVINNLTYQADLTGTPVIAELYVKRDRLFHELNLLENAQADKDTELKILKSILKNAKENLKAYTKCIAEKKVYQGEKVVHSPPNSTSPTAGARNESNCGDPPQGYTQLMYHIAVEVPSVVCGVCAPVLIVLIALRHVYHEDEKMLGIVYVLSQNIVIAILASVAVRCWLLEHSHRSVIVLLFVGLYLFFGTIAPIYWLPPFFSKVKKWWNEEE